jgi:hypothetical protein
MNHLVPIVTSSLPALVTASGERAGTRFLELFAANIGNPHTRRAYSLCFSTEPGPLPKCGLKARSHWKSRLTGGIRIGAGRDPPMGVFFLADEHRSTEFGGVPIRR